MYAAAGSILRSASELVAGAEPALALLSAANRSGRNLSECTRGKGGRCSLGHFAVLRTHDIAGSASGLSSIIRLLSTCRPAILTSVKPVVTSEQVSRLFTLDDFETMARSLMSEMAYEYVEAGVA